MENSKRSLSIISVLFIILNLFSFKISAEENIIPDYEVKFLLDSSAVLSSNYELKKSIRELFDISQSYETIGILYIDTEDKDFNQNGWINRIRIKEDADDFELTYKKRYPVENGNVTSALLQANIEGFDITDTNYEAQIDWGYNKMTLSLSNNKTYSNEGYDDLELPKREDAVDMLKSEMPGKLEDWSEKNWGKDMIDDGEKYGPVYYIKYTGKYQGNKISAEIWPILSADGAQTEYITEISFKADDYDQASNLRASLMVLLEQKGIVLHEDSLKTQMILDRY